MTEISSIIERLKSPISKAEILALSGEVGAMGSLAIDKLIPCLYYSNALALRTSWLLENIIIPNEKWHQVFQEKLVVALVDGNSPAARRNLAKTIASFKISAEYYDQLYDFSINRISDSEEAVAVKVHCIAIAFQIVKAFPDLATELKAVLEDELSKNSVAFAANARKIIKKLEKLSV